MKILIVLLRKKGGVGRANGELGSELRKKGHKVDILSREDDLGVYSLIKSIFPLRRRVSELLKRNDYDVVYTQDYSCTIPMIFPVRKFKKWHFACFCGVKSGKHPELIQWHHRFLQRLVGKIMGKKLVVIGDQLKEIFPRAKLIYRGVNVKKFKPTGRKRDSLGWIDKDIELISKDELEKICKQNGLRLLIAKNTPPESMNEFYNHCKVFVDLPRTAGFNLAWLEAMAAGVPIVVGNKEGAGSFLPFDKVLGVGRIKEIGKIIKNPKKLRYRDWIMENKFTWEDKAKELALFFEGK